MAKSPRRRRAALCQESATHHVCRCATWSDVLKALDEAPTRLNRQGEEELWFRGVGSPEFALSPTLFRWLAGERSTTIDAVEEDLFFEFQARARELHERGLSDWDFLFFMRHHRVPTRILDWTDAFGVALYFALEEIPPADTNPSASVWVLNPYRLNVKSWNKRELVQPKYLGRTTYLGRTKAEPPGPDLRDYGEMLIRGERWRHDRPVAIYPLQISDRMRAQRGWFTMFGNDTRPLEHQVPGVLVRIDLVGKAVVEAGREFLKMAGLRPYSIYPDLDHLGVELKAFHDEAWDHRARGRVRTGG